MITEQISDDVTRLTRRRILQEISDRITTEDLELIHEHFPHLMVTALHEILNPTSEVL